MSRILVTGGAGFIGSTYVRTVLDERPDDRIVVFDKLTYAGRKENLEDVWDAIEFVEGAIENREAVRGLGVAPFVQVSTDEVYGPIEEGPFTAASPIAPSSPSSATKAGGDLLVQAHVHTHKIEAVIARGSNNYGPRQYPEKLIPLMILNALHGDPLPVYGDGKNVRNWIHAEDFAPAIDTRLIKATPGQVCTPARPSERRNP